MTKVDFPHLPSPPRIHLAWFILPCLAADGLMMPVVTSLSGPPHDIGAAFALGIIGCVLAQGCLLAAWVAWGNGPFGRRLAAHWIVAASLYAVWLVGFGVAVALSGRIPPQIAATVARLRRIASALHGFRACKAAVTSRQQVPGTRSR